MFFYFNSVDKTWIVAKNKRDKTIVDLLHRLQLQQGENPFYAEDGIPDTSIIQLQLDPLPFVQNVLDIFYRKEEISNYTIDSQRQGSVFSVDVVVFFDTVNGDSATINVSFDANSNNVQVIKIR